MKRLLGAAALVAVLAFTALASFAAPDLAFAQSSSAVSATPPVEIVTCPTTPAADTTRVCAPAGDWVGDAALALPGLLATIIMGVILRFLPAQLKAFLTTQRTTQLEQLLERGLGLGASRLADELKGKGISVDVKNKMLRDGLQYAIDHGAPSLIKWAGGDGAIVEKLEARLATSAAVASVTKPAATSVAQTTVVPAAA
jgi:hypothetical protein